MGFLKKSDRIAGFRERTVRYWLVRQSVSAAHRIFASIATIQGRAIGRSCDCPSVSSSRFYPVNVNKYPTCNQSYLLDLSHRKIIFDKDSSTASKSLTFKANDRKSVVASTFMIVACWRSGTYGCDFSNILFCARDLRYSNPTHDFSFFRGLKLLCCHSQDSCFVSFA